MAPKAKAMPKSTSQVAALDSRPSTHPVRIQCASRVSLPSIFSTAQQRRLLRTQGMAKSVIDAIVALFYWWPSYSSSGSSSILCSCKWWSRWTFARFSCFDWISTEAASTTWTLFEEVENRTWVSQIRPLQKYIYSCLICLLHAKTIL